MSLISTLFYAEIAIITIEKITIDRVAALSKAKYLIKNPTKYNKSTTYRAAKYVKTLTFDSNTCEILESPQVLYLKDLWAFLSRFALEIRIYTM